MKTSPDRTAPSAISRRALVLAAGAGLLTLTGAATVQDGTTSAVMGALKAKLASGANATLVVIGDSTAYSEFGPFYQLGAALGAAADCTVVLCRWAEWDIWQASGPKTYDGPTVLRAGPAGTLTLYLAALPGAVAGAMFDTSRRAAAIDAIPAPDAIIWHHGHNHASFEQPLADFYGLGAGHFLGAVGLASMVWPGVPQALVVQNPWRDSHGYDKIRKALLSVSAAHAGIEVIDGFTPFLDQRRALALYRDNIHPSDRRGEAAGATLTCDVLMAAWRDASASAARPTPSWPAMTGTNLIDNGDFRDWRGSAPTGWIAEGSVGLARHSATTGGAPFSVAMTPDVIRPSAIAKTLSAVELGRVKGKRVSLAALVRADASQPAPFGILATRSGGASVTFAVGGGLAGVRDGWTWLVAADVPIDDDAVAGSTVIKLFPAWAPKLPRSRAPVLVQKVVLVEGALPKGLLVT